MTTPMPTFCTQCGAPLRAGTRFCGQCGAAIQPLPAAPAAPAQPPAYTPPAPQAAPPVQAAPYQGVPQPPAYAAPQPPAYAAPQPVAEPVTGVLPGLQRHKGFLGMGIENLTLVLTPQRMLFALLTNRMMNEAVTAARDEAKSQGKGFFGQWAAQLAWLGVIARQYQGMTAEAILAQNRDNWAISNSQVRRVRLRNVTVDEENARSELQMIVETTGGKFKFVLTGANQREARQLLRQTLGGVVQ
jgi:hypothetical protein